MEKNSLKRRKITYSPSLTPLPSSLRPQCPARDRLYLWSPTTPRSPKDAQGNRLPLSQAEVEKIRDVMVHAFADSTRETYGSGLLVFHVFCDSKSIPEDQRAPASRILISSFITEMAGHYSGKTVSNYVHGVRAWHILHGVPWSLGGDMEIDTLFKAAISLTPSSSKKPKRDPYTISLITAIRENLNLSSPLDAAVFACLTTTFFTCARVGEFTVPRLDAFNPTLHIKPSDISKTHDRQGLEMTNFHIPRTKMSVEGEDVFWARQLGPVDPQEALSNHIRVNEPSQDGALFAYRHKNSLRPLTKTCFLKKLAIATKAAGHRPVQGHGIRVGGTLEYLLRNVPFDVVKVKGRWASDAFLAYLRRHAQVLAPYMQATPELHEEFLRYTLPPVR